MAETYTCEKCNKLYKKKIYYDAHILGKVCEKVIKPEPEVEENYIRPFLKWVGGKTQILNKVFEKFPKEINSYHEIFLGGGSVLFELLCRIKNNDIKITGTIYAYDFNERLINCYKHIQKKPNKLHEELNKLVLTLNSCGVLSVNREAKTLKEAIGNKESYYYYIRNQFNKKNIMDVNTSAMFIFLNKTCFRGLYRCGPNGFNVPYGNNKMPYFPSLEHITELSRAIKGVQFFHNSFEESILNINVGDFAYMDPPYAPENDKSFVGYNSDGFNLDKHKKLFEMCNTLRTNGKQFVMSNSDVPFITEHFPETQYNIERILCKRSINSKDPGAKTNEVIIMAKPL